jgi:hypothetical protein
LSGLDGIGGGAFLAGESIIKLDIGTFAGIGGLLRFDFCGDELNG